jgi:hypothetical protein
MNSRQLLMDFQKRFELNPLPLEKEFRTLSIKRRLSELSREELEEFLSESLGLLAKMTHQLTQLRDYIEELEGKSIES